MKTKIAFMALLFLIAFIFFWMFRYDISTTPNHFFKHDRWTGKTEYFAYEGMISVRLGKLENTIYDIESGINEEKKQTVEEILGPRPKE